MTSRRRVATLNFSPVATAAAPTTAGGAAVDSNRISLEHKLELLEARFTMPLAYQQQQQQQRANNTTNHNDDSTGSSPATLDPENSSPSALPTSASTTSTAANNNNNNGSQHSFGFDTPSFSYQNSFQQKKAVKATGSSDSSSAAANRRATASPPTPKWADVAVAHMEKVAQQSQDHTLLTSHVRRASSECQSRQENESQQQATTTTESLCVKESPPFISPKAASTKMTTTKMMTAANDAQPKKENKRKSMVPVKRNQPSVKSGGIIAVASSNNDPPQEQERKRTRLHFDKQQQQQQQQSNNKPTTTTSQAKSKSPLRSRNSKPATGSNSPRLTTTTTGDNNNNSKHSSKNNKVSNNAKIDDFFATTKKKSSKPSAKSTGAAVTPHETLTNAASANHQQMTQAPPPPPKQARSSMDSSSVEASLQKKRAAQQEQELERLQQQCTELQRTCQDKDEQLKAVANNRTILHSALQATLRQREQEIVTLQQKSSDRETQTAAVLENLVRADACQEAREIREKLASDGARLGRIVTAPTTSRMLMQHRAAVLESWEDGHASKLLQKRRLELQNKRAVLEERQKAALQAEKKVLQQHQHEDQTAAASSMTTKTANHNVGLNNINGDDDNNDAKVSEANDDTPIVVGGIEVRTVLDAREAVESVRWHLSNVRRKEQELAREEQSLNDEKCAHIRALKRVASEDASRFRSRPKLHDRYVLQSLLGKGGFSEVWRAYDLVELREVAVKIHQLDSRWPDAKKESYTKHVSREYEIQRNVRHPRIVSLYDVFEIDNNSFATVLECCDGTDLDTLLKTKRRLAEPDARAILLQILSGMNYLSHPSEDGKRQGIIHYDLKPGNILFDEFGDAKITDFGLSKIIDSQDPSESMELTSQGAGTYWYLPPECFVMSENVRISNKVDVWSIGVIFYQMLFGRRPFGDGQSQDRILADKTMLNAHEVQFPDKPEVSNPCQEFIRTCLTYDQSFRPSIAELCQNSYVLASDCNDK